MLIDDVTKKEITDRAYVVLKPHIVLKDPVSGDPEFIYSADTQDYYKEEIVLADSTFIQMLIDMGKVNLRRP